jgi:hypothetical protein
MATGSSVSRNINSIRRNIKNMKKEVKEKTIEAFEDVVLDLAIKAVDLAPEDTGDLKKSADPEVKVKGSKITATVTFSAKNPINGYDYALIQHEVNFKHPNGGQWKYLEQPLKENRDRYKKFVADKIKEATRRGTNSRR